MYFETILQEVSESHTAAQYFRTGCKVSFPGDQPQGIPVS